MGATIIDFALAAQRRKPRTLEDACRDEILRDFLTWPRAFRERLDVKRALARTDDDSDPDHSQLGRVVSRREHRGTRFAWFPNSLHGHLGAIRASARELRAARHRPRAARNRARDLRNAKDRLLWFLFEYGFRKVPRKLLAEIANGELGKERAELRKLIEHETAALCRAHLLAAGGVCKTGARAGQPFSERYLKRVRGCAERAEERLSSAFARLAYLESSPPPLRAWRFDP